MHIQILASGSSPRSSASCASLFGASRTTRSPPRRPAARRDNPPAAYWPPLSFFPSERTTRALPSRRPQRPDVSSSRPAHPFWLGVRHCALMLAPPTHSRAHVSPTRTRDSRRGAAPMSAAHESAGRPAACASPLAAGGLEGSRTQKRARAERARDPAGELPRARFLRHGQGPGPSARASRPWCAASARPCDAGRPDVGVAPPRSATALLALFLRLRHGPF